MLLLTLGIAIVFLCFDVTVSLITKAPLRLDSKFHISRKMRSFVWNVDKMKLDKDIMIFNTMTRKKEAFVPAVADRVSLYRCVFFLVVSSTWYIASNYCLVFVPFLQLWSHCL